MSGCLSKPGVLWKNATSVVVRGLKRNLYLGLKENIKGETISSVRFRL